MVGYLNKKSEIVRLQILAFACAIALLIPAWSYGAPLGAGVTSAGIGAAATASSNPFAAGAGEMPSGMATSLISNILQQPMPLAQPSEKIDGSGDSGSKKSQQDVTDERVVNEFQSFIAQSTGQRLPLFGANLFEGGVSTFAPVDNVPVTPDYLIGPGDQIVIKGWGTIDIDFTSVVNRNGEINLPKVGSVSVAGVRYQDLQRYLKSAIGKVYRNFELNVTLGKLRSIQVFVLGQARRPGVYTVSSLSTLVNTLFETGGPSANGSMRNIEVKRNGKTITRLDLYELLLKGNKTKDVSLLPGDIIYIPSVGAQVAIYGSVKKPAIFELKGGTTKLFELLELAGGLTTTAAGQKVLLERIEGRTVRKVEEVELNLAGLEAELKDGDLVQVFSIGARFDNAVTLRGNVAAPGRYPWKEGMRVSDLIPDKQALITPDYWVKQNMATQRISAQDRSQGQAQGQPQGQAQRQAQGQDRSQGQGWLQGEIKRSVSEINWDYALIERLNPDLLTTQLIPFNLGKAVAGDAQQNMQLQPGDLITIFSQDDMQVPISNRSVYVRLEGEIAAAGVYKALPGETLRGLVKRVGGFTPNAFLFGAEFDRESVRILQQKKLNEMLDKMEQSIRRNLAGKERGASTAEEAASSQATADAQFAVVAKMREAKATGRVVLEMDDDNSGKIGELPDIVLEDGDRLLVPSKPAVVGVMGMVYNENAFMYKPGKRVSDYLEQAGGPTRDADKDRIYLLRADGSVASAQNSSYLFFFNSFANQGLQPGDAIIVPELLDKFQFTKELKDWTQIFYQFALGVTSLKVLHGL